MKIHDTALPEVKRITLDMLRDDRGFFCERFHVEKLAALGVMDRFVQINHSRSRAGVLRGLHFQHTPLQGKLVGVTRGRILDVAVDLRPNSPRFCQSVAVELSDENGELLWIPAGFGHGFCVLGDAPADVLYNVTAHYAPGGESGVQFDDAAFGIHWPIAAPVISDRDRALPTLAEAKADLTRWFGDMR